jgi:signal transduction histidine kinase/CheY-like chemotaxis protein
LDKYRSIILKCHQNKKASPADAAKLLVRYKKTYQKLITQVESIEKELNDLITSKMATFKKLYVALLVNVIVLFLFVAYTFNRYSKNRQKAEIALATAKDNLTAVLNTIDTILVSVDEQCLVTEWNTAAEKYTKISSEAAIGKPVAESLPLISGYIPSITKVYHTHTPVELYRERITTDKERVFDISMNYTAGLDNVVLQVDDVTEHEMKDEQLRQSSKMRVVSNLIGGLANNFNNVLGAIIGTISMIRYSIKNKENPLDDIQANLEVIESSAEKAEVMVQQLLGLAEEQEPEFKPIDLNFIVRHLMTICENTFDKSVELNAELYSVTALVNADPKQIEQALLSLCDNAVQAIMANTDPEAVRDLTVSLDHVTPDRTFREKQPLAVKDNYWTISVADTGVGMDKSVIARMFEPFYTTKPNATGLGLAVVRDIVTQHDGFMEVRSDVGVGTIMTIYLPEYVGQSGESTEDVKPDYSEHIPLGEGVVMVVDDEEVMRKTASSILTKLGYTVITANDGEEAVEIFKKRHGEIDLTLMDLSMPKMSGKDAYVAMKEIDPELRVLLVSGLEDDRIREALDIGMDGYLKKPYSLVSLAQEVKKALG